MANRDDIPGARGSRPGTPGCAWWWIVVIIIFFLIIIWGGWGWNWLGNRVRPNYAPPTQTKPSGGTTPPTGAAPNPDQR